MICKLIIASISGVYKKSHLISVDEKTGIQAIYRKQSSMKTGKIKRLEYEYVRNGTTSLIAAQDVSTGEMICGYLGTTRKEPDFLAFCQQTEKLFAKEDGIIFLADQLNIHKSVSLVKWIAGEIGFEGDLGKKVLC